MPVERAGVPTLVPLAAAHVPVLAALVAGRVAGLRAAVPAVPDAWADPATVARLIHGLVPRGGGIVALRDGVPVGYQASTFIDGHGSRWSYTAALGHVASGRGRGRTIAAIYAHLAESWVRDHCLEHVVTILADDAETIDAFVRLGFGRTIVDLVRDLAPVRAATSDPSVAIRRAGPPDAAAVHGLNLGLRRHVLAAPVFRPLGPPRPPELYRHELADPASATFLAEADGRPLAFLRIGPPAADIATIVRDPGTASITGAFTVPERRGGGVASALLATAIGWARETGHVRVAVDHESANGEAERFWRRHFHPVAYSMTRRLPPQVGR